MAVIRLRSQDLFVHSPAPLTDELRRELDVLGRVRYVVPASWIHGHLYMDQYGAAYPDAELFAAPGLQSRRSDLAFAGDLDDRPDPRWAGELDQAVFRGPSGSCSSSSFGCDERLPTMPALRAWGVRPPCLEPR